ncbi:hypothetical protein AX16_010658 [Volvariella volvacea WC 439]|nr:hypothetical protein AX16_010658 [Volvariella volvacea WC 439]
MPPPPALLTALRASLGTHHANLEYKWLKAAASSQASLSQMLTRRIAGEPLQYILGAVLLSLSLPLLLSLTTLIVGSQPFGPLNLLVRPPVLIPRPETEHWVFNLAKVVAPTAQNPYKLLDLGTGSGCIPLLLCHLWHKDSLRAHGVDISDDAIHLTRENAQLCRCDPSTSPPSQLQNTFTVSRANILSPHFWDQIQDIRPPFDIITSNPPYIAWEEYLELPKSVSDFEDPKALFGGPSGLDFYYAIARLLRQKDILNPGGIVALEVGHKQAKDVQTILQQVAQVAHTEIWTDPWHKERTVIARMC